MILDCHCEFLLFVDGHCYCRVEGDDGGDGDGDDDDDDDDDGNKEPTGQIP